jgi:hypothetical protein
MKSLAGIVVAKLRANQLIPGRDIAFARYSADERQSLT